MTELLYQAAAVGAPGAAQTLSSLKARHPRADAYSELLDMVGMQEVKKAARDFVAKARIDQLRRERGLRGPTAVLHCVFSGPPGTGKTSVARIIGRLLGELGILSRGHVKEVDRAGLVGRYVGETALKVDAVVAEALGGVLFIDEAYSLSRSQRPDDYGHEAIAALVKRMEDHRADFVVIVAGYEDEMEKFLQANPGLDSRFPWRFQFRHYLPAELLQLFHQMAAKDGIRIAPECSSAAFELFGRRAGCDRSFGNGRYVRTVYENAAVRQAARLARHANPANATNEELQMLLADDLASGDR